MRFLFYSACLCIMLSALFSCGEKKQFSALSASETGLQFQNTITETPENNIMTYQYMYNGAGIAAGDLNNDGLPDLYVCGNSVANKLFLNRGNWKFDDVTEASGAINRAGDWKTGVTMADVNGDGWLDIYVCYSGNTQGEGFNKPVIRENAHRTNQLFINKGCKPGGTPTFIESAAQYGLEATGTFSTQAYFFDYDNDGDLDMLLLNHANTFYSTFFNTTKLRNRRHPYFGNRLYRNDSGHFSDASDSSGIAGGGLNFSLGAAISDFNNDGYPDIYITNDYDEQDFCYLNQKNGTFRDISHTAMGHLSKYGMGTDAADVNNDMRTDIFVADMLPADNERQKLLKGADQYDKYMLAVDSGFHYQNMRNTFQLNVGVAPDSVPMFREVGQQAGIAGTDWSWAPLFADFDNDGWKDLFITNGYLHDYTNLDFLKFKVSETLGKDVGSYDVMKLIQDMPSTKLTPYAFRNKGGWQFSNASADWGFTDKSISNGAVYADFDNDGDLDLIFNRLNDDLGIYRNNNEVSGNHFVKIKLEGDGKNTAGIGAKVYVTTDSNTLYQEAFYGRGYESSVEPLMTFGVGKATRIKAIKVLWNDKKESVINNVEAGKIIVIKQSESTQTNASPAINTVTSPLHDYTANSGISFVHHEDNFVDFKSQRLLPYQLSRLGGKMATGDVNGDGNDDVFFGGASGQSGQLFLGDNEGLFHKSSSQPWAADSLCEDIDALFFDADGDKDLDLYVVSGGNEWKPGDSLYHDRLYLNNGKGEFTKATQALPASEAASGSCVSAADFDHDGDPDLFIGSRLSPGDYPAIPKSLLLRNDSQNGNVRFTDVTDLYAKTLSGAGMITSAVWTDIDKDGWLDLLLAGDWMPLKLFRNNKGNGFTDISAQSDLTNTSGLWTTLYTGDFDGDGAVDFMAGNAGTNLPFHASETAPMQYYRQDINNDGTSDPILCYDINGTCYPSPTYDELMDQVPPLRKKFYKYGDYANAVIGDVLGQKDVKPYLTVSTLTSSFFHNDGHGKFRRVELPAGCQSSMIQGFVQDDFDGDKKQEILCAGNFFPYKVEWGKSDAFFGALLQISGDKIAEKKVPLWLTGDIRDVKTLSFRSGKKAVIVSRNNDKPGIYLY